MSYSLKLTPSGHLQLAEDDGGNGDASDAWIRRVAAAFSSSTSEGLFALTATKPDTPPPLPFSYWRDFGGRYLTQLCRTPDTGLSDILPIEPPVDSELSTLLLSAPPMQGAEYLTLETLTALWIELDSWIHQAVAESNQSLSDWLEKQAPMWRRVGRVCFHLAENKRDQELPFAFLATYAPSLSKGGRVQYLPLGKALQEYAGEKNRAQLINLLTPVHRASEKIDFVREMVEAGDIYHPLAWTPGEAYRLLQNVLSLEECGLLVRLPDWWKKRPRPRASVTIGQKKQSGLGLEAMLDFKVGLALGDQDLTEEEFQQLLNSEDGLVYIKGQWVEVDREKLSQALAHWKRVEAEAAEQGVSFIEGMRLLAGAPMDLTGGESSPNGEREWAFVNAGEWLSDILSDLRNPDGLTGGRRSENFRGVLRHYQEIGHDWLWLLSNLGLGACLADDMGLGKTVQILSLLLALKENTESPAKPSLLVLPASLLGNWKAELERFAPTLKAVFVHPSETEKTALVAMADRPGQVLSGADMVVTTYGLLPRQKWLLDIDWRLVILDEAQAIKNPSAQQTKTVKQLKSRARIALTGTPIENRLSDLWSLFDFLCPGLLGSTGAFKKFIKGLENREEDRYAPLRNLVSPYILRRLKTDKSIIADLPDKTEMKVYCGLAKAQAAMYARAVKELAAALDGLDGMKRRGLVLAYLMRFKQICNHPSQFNGDGGYDPAQSGKFNRLRAIGEEIASRQEKALVFTQFREMTEPIAAFLAEIFGREGLVLHGGTAVKKRKTFIDMFQREDGPPFFVLSLKAGGVGLNLTAASQVIHFDRWWNPAVENQATDRAFRIGQHRNVIVHKFICRGTIEEKIDALIEEKTGLADDILKAGAESMLTEMSNEELLKAVALDIDRAGL